MRDVFSAGCASAGAKQAAEKRTLGKTDLGRYFCCSGKIVSKEECVGKTRSRVGCSAM
jgi:hypothetical protein